MKKYSIGIILTLILSLGIVTSVYTQEDNVPQARFSFYHASPNAPAIDILVEDEILFSNVKFGTETEFKTINSGNPIISINISGTDQTVLGPIKAKIKQGRDHILFVTGMVESTSGSRGMQALEAKILVKKTRPAFFRFYNTSPDLGNVNVYLGNDLYFENVEYGQPTKFEKVSAGNINLIVRKGRTDVVSPIDVNFEPGKAYTVVLLGLEDGQETTKLKIDIVEE